MNEILYWMENSNKKSDENIRILKKKYETCCQEIINNNINLYSNENYSYNNIWGLYYYDKKQTQNYIKNIICDKYIFRLLNDMISKPIGTNGYGYSIRKENIEALAPNIDIDDLIKKHGTSLSPDEKFIKEIYMHYKSEKYEFDNAIYTTELKLIDKI